MMGGVETERSQTIIFDPMVDAQKDEADIQVAKLLRQGFVIDNSHNVVGEILLNPPPMKASMGLMRILTKNGDDRVVWNRDFPDQIKDAYKMFKDFLAKGYTAYIAMTNGEKGHSIDEFDPLAEEIIMVPSTMPG
jgi:hypothetical protein